MRISVLPRHIEKGVPTLARDCPVALAIADAFKSIGVRPFVLATSVRWDGVVYQLPGDVVEAITRFDRGGGMEPFAFDMQRPDALPA